MKRVLLVAFHYPPLTGGSGIHRTLKFSRYLPDLGWQPVILTASLTAYSRIAFDQIGEIPPAVQVKRAFALDARRHYSIRGAYPKLMALPDRWITWWVSAVPYGLWLVRKYRPDVIWSTYPIATAHLIALTLHRLTGISWVADFRDSMTEEGFPPDATTWNVYRWIEQLTVKSCSRAVFTAPGTLRMYAERYPTIALAKWILIPNGYDEADFAFSGSSEPARSSPNVRIVLLHSGVLYPFERDPLAFFGALKHLRETKKVTAENLQIILRASGYEDYYHGLICKHGVHDIVSLAPPLPFKQALLEILNADGLLLFQASNCNHQIPAKLYEYMRAQRPIFAMTDPTGDTAILLRSIGVHTIADLTSQHQVAQGLLDFLALIRQRRAPIPDADIVAQHSRASRTRELASLLDSVIRRSE